MKTIKNTLLSMILILAFYSTGFSQWTPASGPWGGTINTIFVDGSDLWVGTDVAGIFYSSDGGSNWVERNIGLSSYYYNSTDNGLYITCFARFDSLLFVGTQGGGLYRSTNNGTEWARSDSGITTPYISSIIKRGGNLIVGTGRYGQGGKGIYVSSDGGTTWVHIVQVIPANHVVGFCTIPQNTQGPATVYTIVRDSIFKSTDDGLTWSKPSGSMPSTGYLSLAAFGSTIYAGRYPTGINIGGVVQFSKDSSQTWHTLGTNEPGFGKVPLGFAVLDSVLYIAAAADELGSNEYGGIFTYNINQGGNAVESDSGLSWFDGRSIAVAGSTIFAGFTHDGLYRSDNQGFTWTKSENGISNTTVGSIVKMGRYMFAAAGMTGYSAASRGNGVYRSSDGGATWSTVTVGMPNHSMVVYNLYTSQGILLLSTSKGIYQSPDSGDTWYKANGIANSNYVSSRTRFSSVQTGFVTNLTNGWALSQDLGINWNVFNSPSNALGIMGMDSVLLESGQGPVLNRSTDNGTSWTLVNNSFGAMVLTSYGRTIFGYEPSGWMRKSDDLGLTWTSLGLISALPAYNTYLSSFVAVVNGTDTTLFTSTGSTFGIYESTNMGQTWTQINTGLFGATMLDITLFTDDEYLYVGTNGRGIWKRPLSELITAVEDNAEPVVTSYALLQNYPNPFNPSTTIKYSIPEESFVTLKVFNSIGQQVAELVNETKPAGNYSVSFSASELSSGIYFYKMKAGSFVQVKKMILIK